MPIPHLALRILKSVRELREDVPVLVRTQDDTKLDELQAAGATEVVPETLEASLMLMSHMLLLLNMPVSRVVKTVGDIRDNRYSMLRRIFRREDARPIDETHALRDELHTVVLPRNAYAIGRSITQLKLEEVDVSVNAIRRDGIVGRQPDGQHRFPGRRCGGAVRHAGSAGARRERVVDRLGCWPLVAEKFMIHPL